jgi:enterochelin esterase family protein
MIAVMAYGHARRAGQLVSLRPGPACASRSAAAFGTAADALRTMQEGDAFQADMTDAPIRSSIRRSGPSPTDNRAMAGHQRPDLPDHAEPPRSAPAIGGSIRRAAAGPRPEDRRTAPCRSYCSSQEGACLAEIGTAVRSVCARIHISKALTDAGIDHVYVESQGTDHEWQTWRRNLNDFAPRLFR